MPNNQSTTDQALKLENQLCFALYSTSLAMTKVYKSLLAVLGLTYPQYVVMLVLWEKDDLMVSEIGERLFLDSGTLTPLLKRLESSALVTRQRDKQDERRVRVKLTNTGIALKQQASHVPACVIAQTQAHLPKLRTLSQDLKTLRAHLMS